MFHTRFLLGLLLVGLVPFAALGAACSDDAGDDKNAEQSVRDAVNGIADAQKNGDADAFLALVTDRAIEKEFFSTRDDIKANPDSIRDDTPVAVESVQIDGQKASANVVLGASPVLVKLVKDGESWKLDDIAPRSVDGPDGAKTVEVQMKEFAFEFDSSAVTSDTPITFNLKNVGEQDHFMALVKVPQDLNLEEALGSD